MIGARAWAVVRGGFAGLAAYGLIAYALLSEGQEVWCWRLPLYVFSGIALFVWMHRGQLAERPAPAPRWLLWTTVAVTAVVFLALVYGAYATPARAWDGIVAWELKANALAEQPSLQHPLFADPAVWHHSASYPLLQPLCVASLAQSFGPAGGRLLFPLLWLAFVLTGGLAVMRASSDGRRGCWVLLALATTPFFVNTSGGAADSGYADMFFATALTGVAAGFLLRDAVLLTAATLLLPLIKPEGMIIVGLVPLVGFVFCQRRWWWGSALAAGVALSFSYMVSYAMTSHRFGGSWHPPEFFAVALGPIGLRWFLDKKGAGIRTRLLVGTAIVAIAVVWMWALPREVTGSALGRFLDGFALLGDRLSELPAILWGLVSYGLSPRRFGITFTLLPLIGWVLWRNRRAMVTVWPMAVLLALGLLVVLGALLLAPESDVQHRLRSSATRLLSHWVGVAWIVIGAVWGTKGPD